jgi:hypothetical protein
MTNSLNLGHIVTLLIVATLLVMLAGNSRAQGLPQTDIWLATMNSDLPGQPVKINPTAGYNNQPHFSADGTIIYYTREMPGVDGGAQTDIAAYILESGTTTMVADTNESEYSPTPIPGRSAVSVIQVEADQKQRLWAINTDNGQMDLLLPQVEPVGYHAWRNNSEVAMFILGESFTLQVAVLGGNDSKVVADNIGRSIRKHPLADEILFVDKNDEPWQIAAYLPATKTTHSVLPLFPAGEDFTIDSTGAYWTGNGSRLYRRATDDKRWELMADFSALGITNITRLAINPTNDKIALVSDH